MRARHLCILLAVLMSTACSSYEEEQKVEVVLTQSVNRFHEQINNEQFHDIYMEADPSLRQRIDEAAFTNQLKNAHDQLGKVSPEKKVLLASRAWNDLEWSRFFRRKEIVFLHELPDRDLINASERFEWSVENNQPKLARTSFGSFVESPAQSGLAHKHYGTSITQENTRINSLYRQRQRPAHHAVR
jgi:hypothetical protein